MHEHNDMRKKSARLNVNVHIIDIRTIGRFCHHVRTRVYTAKRYFKITTKERKLYKNHLSVKIN